MPLMESKDLLVDEFDAASATKDQIVQSLVHNGGCIVRGMLKKGDVDSIEKQVRPYIEADKAFEGGFFPPEARRVNGLVGKIPQYTELIPGNSLWRAVCDELLTSRFECWVGSQKKVSVSKPQLSNTTVFCINPGARAQELHHDDMIHHNFQPAITADQYTMGRDTGIGFFVAGKRTTKENGATRFVPRSHLQATNEPPCEADAVYAELEPGDGFIMLSSCYHGGSANMTENEERLLYSCFMTKGYLRQEENQYLANPIEKVKKYPVDIQQMIGFSISKPFLGWVDLQDPRKQLLDDASKNIWHLRQTSALERLRRVELIWACKDTAAFEWFQALLASLEALQNNAHGDGGFLRIHIYLTQRVGVDMANNIAINSVGTDADPLTQLRSRTNFGRPNFAKILCDLRDEIVDPNAGFSGGREGSLDTSVGVYFCARDIKKACKEATCQDVKFKFWKEHF